MRDAPNSRGGQQQAMTVTTAADDRFMVWLSFFRARAGKDIFHSVVSFVARVLEQRTFRIHHRNLSLPRSHKRCFVSTVNSYIMCGVGARESLGQPQRVARASEVRFVGEVCRLDDQGMPSTGRANRPATSDVRRQCGRPSVGMIRASWIISTESSRSREPGRSDSCCCRRLAAWAGRPSATGHSVRPAAGFPVRPPHGRADTLRAPPPFVGLLM